MVFFLLVVQGSSQSLTQKSVESALLAEVRRQLDLTEQCVEHTSSEVLKSIESDVNNLSKIEERLRIQTLQWGISNAAEVAFSYYYLDSPSSQTQPYIRCL